jgi:predicted alpha/beta superfamily hydrolase
MRRNLLMTLLLLLLFPVVNAQQVKPYKIEFVLVSPSLADDSSVYICGNLNQLAGWNPSSLKMKNRGNHTWSFTINSSNAIPVEYKYTLGSWQREGANADGIPLSNFIIKVTSDTVVNDNVFFWLNNTKRKITGQITGEVRYHQKLSGKGIQNRDVIVWLPPDYNDNEKNRYPVLYMEDGQNIFDPLTSAFGVDWQIDETADSLIRNKIIEPIIIVGIYNTKDRMSEYTPGGGTAYMDFVVKTVKPFIDNNYRTLPDRKNTLTGGSSAGGTISFMLLWNYPSVFSGAICMSPAFKIQNIDLVKEVSAYSGKRKPVKIYIDNGGKGLEERLQPGVDEMIKALEIKGYRRNKNLFLISAPDAEHNEAAWAKRMPEALKIMVGK